MVSLALGRNVLVGFMSFDGFNYEDAIIISEELVRNDTYTSIHIEDFDVEIRETKLGREEFTRDIPNVSEKALRNLDDSGIVQVGTYVKPGDILVGKVSPKSKTELTPEEKLLHAIFGRAGEDVKNDSLEVPSGIEGIVIDTQKFSRRMSLSDDERKEFETRNQRGSKRTGNEEIASHLRIDGSRFGRSGSGPKLKDSHRALHSLMARIQNLLPKERPRSVWTICLDQIKDEAKQDAVRTKVFEDSVVQALKRQRSIFAIVKLNSMKRGDELRSGVLQMAKVYIATKRVISVGDKMAGRHGNKGVIAKILPIADMPFLPDGTPLANSCSIRSASPVG